MEYVEEILENGEEELIDWEDLLFNFDEKEIDDAGNRPSSNREEEEEKTQDVIYREIEKELMNDDDDQQNLESPELTDNYIETFLADVLNSSPDESSTKHNDDSAASNNDESLQCSGSLDHKNMTHTEAEDDAAAAKDPVSKKRKRQLRNRDAAVRSRERKKMYVKDLETKSRFLESECRRLGRLLQCSYAENHALRYTLHMSSASGAPMAKQESAVLFLELLLLGSLLWFLGITCQLNVPTKFQTTPVVSKRNPGLENQAPREQRSGMFEFRVSPSHMKSRRCRGSSTKMKAYLAVSPILT